MKRSRAGYIDLEIGGFERFFGVSAILVVLIAIPSYSGVVLQNVFAGWPFLGALGEQFALIASGRENVSRSIIVLWSAGFLSLISFPCFLFVIPSKSMWERYLQRRWFFSYVKLIAGTIFLLLGVFLGVYSSLVVAAEDWGRVEGKYSEMIKFFICTDIGLGLSLLLPLMAFMYCSATVIKTFYAHVFYKRA